MAASLGLALSSSVLQAQDGPPAGDFNPAQMRERMEQRLREAMEVKDDAEWKVISERITAVMDARRAARDGGGMMGFRPPGGPPLNRDVAPDQNGAGTTPPDAGPGPGNREEFQGPRNRPPASPEAGALKKAIDAKAPAAELKTKLAEFKAARAKKQADLEKAREDLRQVLSVQQEAVATTFGLL